MLYSLHTLATRLPRRVTTVLLLATTATGWAGETVSFSALYFNAGTAQEPAFFIASGDKKKKIAIPLTSLGGPFKATVREGGMVDFFAAEADERPAVSVKLPAGKLDDLLMVFVADGGSYQARALTLPGREFCGGTIFAVNLAATDVAIRRGGNAQQAIKPGDHQLLTLPADFSEPMVPVQIFKRDPAGAWEI
ncbi:MAG TPA: hypothetical protein VF258_03540, partial [Luteolibacter sp.]